MRIQFNGAARSVTGSRHLLEIGDKRILLDCGLVQGRRRESEARNRHLGFDPTSVDAVVLSHAHIDHSGALPSLAKAGYQGPVHCTLATADLLSVMLRDSANIQEHDAEFVSRVRARRGDGPVEPLYTMEDAEEALTLLEGHGYHRAFEVVPGVTATYYDAGHILGSAFVALAITDGGKTHHLVFSGDLGRPGLPILRDPEAPPACDTLIIESTYGNREHAPLEHVEDKLADLVNRVMLRRGKLIIPAFAVGRTQELVYALARLNRAGRIPNCPIYVDSPMAVNVTEVFARHPECFDAEMRTAQRQSGDPLGFSLIHYVRDVEDSIALNKKGGPFVVIAASGMCEAGRIRHHLKHGVGDSKNAVLIVGFMAEHTLGRRLVERATEVAIFGEPYARICEIEVLNELSAHADMHGLMTWVKRLPAPPSQAFVVHGEEKQALPFAERLRDDAGIAKVVVPRLGEIHPL